MISQPNKDLTQTIPLINTMFRVDNNKYVTTCNIGNIAMLLAFTLCGGIVITANVCSTYQSFIVNNTATPGVATYYHDITNSNRNSTKSVGLVYQDQDAMYDRSSECLCWNQSRIFPLYQPTKLHHQ